MSLAALAALVAAVLATATAPAVGQTLQVKVVQEGQDCLAHHFGVAAVEVHRLLVLQVRQLATAVQDRPQASQAQASLAQAVEVVRLAVPQALVALVVVVLVH
jgi:hypothetical protein